MRWLLLMMIGVWVWIAPAGAEETFSTEPVLRIEGGMHTAIIRRAAVDAAGQVAVTVSDDRTARVWSLADGALLRTLRVPIGQRNEGKLFAVAMSPDGKTIAVGGWTAWEWDSRTAIYLFATQTGRMIRRLPGIANVVNHLAFSRDGRLLAAVLAKDSGLRVFRVDNGQQVARDDQYEDHAYWVEFDANGRLVTASYDGHLRLYDAQFKLVAKKRPKADDVPFSVSFSPDGRAVAVGFRRGPGVMVVSGDTLDPLYEPDDHEVSQKLHTVAWSLDGEFLYAGGLHQREGKRLIRRWGAGGRPGLDKSGYQDLPVAADTIMHLLPVAGEGAKVLFITADPAWGVLDGKGDVSLFMNRPITAFRGIKKGLKLSVDGSVVDFAFDPGGKSPARFSVKGATLTLDPPEDKTMAAHITIRPELEVTGWSGEGKLKLNGQPLELKKHEIPTCFAIAPDGEHFVAGTNFFLRYYSKEGREVWRSVVPATCWGANISGDGNMVVIAFGDGTLRWYHAANGGEVMALFAHNDRKRWVAWLPKGYYAASQGAEDLIGWHKNQSKETEASFYPASYFRFVYARPELIRKVFP